MNLLTAWLVAYMQAHSPTTDAARYQDIASDIIRVIEREGPIFKGRDGRVRTAGLLASIMWHESKFDPAVDTSVGRLPTVCMMQIHMGGRRTREGWTAQQLVEDRQKCLTIGLRIAQRSFRMCRHLPIMDRLRAYTSGSCGRGAVPSRKRVKDAFVWYMTHPPSFDDKVFLNPSVGVSSTPTLKGTRVN